MRDTCRDCAGIGCEFCGWVGQLSKEHDERVISTKLHDVHAKKFTDGVYGFTCPECNTENELRCNYTGLYFCGKCKQLLNIK